MVIHCASSICTNHDLYFLFFMQVFDKAAYIAVELNRLKGRGRLHFSRNNGTHWSFAFMEVP